MKNYNLFLLFIMVAMLKAYAQNNINHTYVKTEGPDKNPLKGWNSGWWDSYDVASVGFQYIKWKDFEPTNGNFDFDAVEDVINRPGSAGRHIILRLYSDWFGQNQTSDGAPNWIYTDYGVARLQSGSKYITDYNNPNYISQVTEAIEALAERYDNDPRIYAIQLGVLGYWGEWHNYSYDDPNFEIAESTKTQIINAYKNNFSNSKLMGRYPWREPLTSTPGIGYHNDFFVPNNGHSDEFDDSITQGNKWKEGPIGGEVPPIDDNDREEFMTALYETVKGIDMIETGHYSTMKVGNDERPCANNPSGQRCAGFMALHRKMGYNFQVESAMFAENVLSSDNLSVALTLSNIGVAPIYHNWNVQFALLESDNTPVQVFDTNYDLRTIVENTSSTITIASPLTINPAEYTLGVRLVQPNADKTKNNPWGLDARNTYIVFSNEMTVVDGQWDEHNALTGGWSILGNIVVEDATLGAEDNTLLNRMVTVYPNPASKQNITISSTPNIAINDVQFSDMTGRIIEIVGTKKLTAHSLSLDISNLSTGIYNLTIGSDQGLVQKRFVRQ